MRKITSGFTIVELLIVIVVIGVLAAITIVAYNGIQDRSISSSYKSATDDAYKLIASYISANSAYPYTGRTCMTESPCYYGSAVAVNSTFRTNISSIGSLPSGLQTWNTTYGGVLYDYSAGRTYEGDVYPVAIVYYLKGIQQDCGRPVANTLGATMTLSSNPYTTSISSVTTTICVIPVRVAP